MDEYRDWNSQIDLYTKYYEIISALVVCFQEMNNTLDWTGMFILNKIVKYRRVRTKHDPSKTKYTLTTRFFEIKKHFYSL